jgi:hypothetical protein
MSSKSNLISKVSPFEDLHTNKVKKVVSLSQPSPFSKDTPLPFSKVTPFESSVDTPFESSMDKPFPSSNKDFFYKETSYPQTGPDNSFQIIDFKTILKPTKTRWAIIRMIKVNVLGNKLSWQVAFDDITNQIVTWDGHLNGKIKEPVYFDVVLNNSGRNFQEQAWQIAWKKYIDKIRKGYYPPGTHQLPKITPMLADKYTEKEPLDLPVDCDTKLDGIRSWMRKNGDFVEAFSRNNCKEEIILHILIECNDFFDYLPHNCALDGEIWHPNLKLHEIQSLVTTKEIIKPGLQMLEYHIFDIWTEDNFEYEKRREILENCIREYRKNKFGYEKYYDNYIYGQGGRDMYDELVDWRTKEDFGFVEPGIKLKEGLDKMFYLNDALPAEKTKIFLTNVLTAYSREDIDKFHSIYLENGYEGTMVRKRANGHSRDSKEYEKACYACKRCKNILKYKNFIDEEAECIDVKDSKGNEKGCAVLMVKDIRGNIFPIRMRGTFELRKEWLKDPSMVIGKQITFKYTSLTKNGKPFQPVGITVRDYE